jgi:AraC-like DNA-binding protein
MKTIDISAFTPRDSIEWIWLDTPYYLSPNDSVSQEAFSVIRDAMASQDMVDISRLEPRGKGNSHFAGDRCNTSAAWPNTALATLAGASGMSRCSFAEKFKSVVGVAPLDCVTRWRMHRVRRALIDTDLAFAMIAENNGYRSRTSCSQSFKRMFGHPSHELRNFEPPSFGSHYEDGGTHNGSGVLEANLQLARPAAAI